MRATKLKSVLSFLFAAFSWSISNAQTAFNSKGTIGKNKANDYKDMTYINYSWGIEAIVEIKSGKSLQVSGKNTTFALAFEKT